MYRNHFLFIICFVGIAGLLTGCFNGEKSKHKEKGILSKLNLSYAKGFKIENGKGRSYLSILDVHDSTKVLNEFTLETKECSADKDMNTIHIPCKRIICLSSTQLAYLIDLDALGNIVGINSSRHLFNKQINNEVSTGRIVKVGKEGDFNTELIAKLNPDVIFVSPFKTGGYDVLKNMGIPLVPMGAYAEETPLGRAEWIKMMAAFVGKMDVADSLFKGIASRYEKLKKLANAVHNRPTVFSGKMKAGTWYVAGGDSFFAHYFRDAGADYVIKDDRTGAEPMDYETIYSKAYDADFWRVLTSSPMGFGKKLLKMEDERYATFKAFETGNVLVCNLQQIPYREESCIRPDVILEDYISHFHPDLLPGYKPVFWTKIKE